MQAIADYESHLLCLKTYINEAKENYHKIIEDDFWDVFEACEASIKEQKQYSPDEVKSLTYGEINFESIAEIIYYIKSYCNFNSGASNNKFMSYKLNVLLF